MGTPEFAQSVLDRITKVVGSNHGSVPLHAPSFKGNEWKYVKDCLDTGWVSSVGAYVDRFEADLATYTGAKYAVVTVNGTAALHAAFVLSGVKNTDEVLVPALTFVATANAVAYTGATPHFIDSTERTLGVDVDRLSDYLKEIVVRRNGESFNKKTGRRISTLVVMHTFGHATEIDRLLDLCRPYNIKVVEDAAEALGSYYYGRHLGTFSDIGTLSFNGNKVVTTGGGGALLFQDEALAKRAKHLTTTAKVPHAWEFVHDQVGYNYRLPNINAALGCAQLEELPKSIAKKRRICDLYVKAFSGFDGAKIFTEPAHCKGNYWLNALILDDAHRTERDFILKKTNADKISTRPIWNLMSELPMYNECPKMDLSVSESLRARVVNLPSSPDLILDSELGSN